MQTRAEGFQFVWVIGFAVPNRAFCASARGKGRTDGDSGWDRGRAWVGKAQRFVWSSLGSSRSVR